MDEEKVIKVGSGSSAKRVASAIARTLELDSTATVRSVGVQAVNQTVKAIAIAGGFVGQKGQSIDVRIGFTTLTSTRADSAGEAITALNFVCRLG